MKYYSAKVVFIVDIKHMFLLLSQQRLHKGIHSEVGYEQNSFTESLFYFEQAFSASIFLIGVTLYM